jgi:hypothetical protein
MSGSLPNAVTATLNSKNVINSIVSCQDWM